MDSALPIDPASFFESARTKLGWAKKHLDRLKDEITPWYKGEPYRMIREYDHETRYHTVTLELNAGKEPQLEQWSLMSADCIHNLRTALDHVAYAAAILSSGRNPPPFEDKIYFPITGAPDEFSEKLKRYKLDTVPAEVRAAFESMQPYNRPNPFATAVPPILRLLADFDNRDKHRLLSLVTQQPYHATIDDLGLPLGTDLVDLNVHVGPLKDRTRVLWFSTSQPSPDVKYKVIFTLVIAVLYGGRPNEFIEIGTLNSWFVEEVTSVINTIAGFSLKSHSALSGGAHAQ